MEIANFFRKIVYAILFGFIGILLGIWTADLLYGLGLKNMDRVNTIYFSTVLIILIAIAASLFGFIKGNALLETEQ